MINGWMVSYIRRREGTYRAKTMQHIKSIKYRKMNQVLQPRIDEARKKVESQTGFRPKRLTKGDAERYAEPMVECVFRNRVNIADVPSIRDDKVKAEDGQYGLYRDWNPHELDAERRVIWEKYFKQLIEERADKGWFEVFEKENETGGKLQILGLSMWLDPCSAPNISSWHVENKIALCKDADARRVAFKLHLWIDSKRQEWSKGLDQWRKLESVSSCQSISNMSMIVALHVITPIRETAAAAVGSYFIGNAILKTIDKYYESEDRKDPKNHWFALAQTGEVEMFLEYGFQVEEKPHSVKPMYACSAPYNVRPVFLQR